MDFMAETLFPFPHCCRFNLLLAVKDIFLSEISLLLLSMWKKGCCDTHFQFFGVFVSAALRPDGRKSMSSPPAQWVKRLRATNEASPLSFSPPINYRTRGSEINFIKLKALLSLSAL
jgi:hypothetical protein